MTCLTPARAAHLARRVYRVQSDRRYFDFIDSIPEFEKPDPSNPSHNPVHRIQATRGFRVLNFKGYFAVCAKGTGKWENHRFILIRGSDNAPDWMSNFRAGTTIGELKSRVHIGFQEILTSIKVAVNAFLMSWQACTLNLWRRL